MCYPTRQAIYKITYPNGKIYIGKDLTDHINYFGSASSELIAKDFSLAERQLFSISREIIWSSSDHPDQNVNELEVYYIKTHQSNDLSVGYNQWPKFHKKGKQ